MENQPLQQSSDNRTIPMTSLESGMGREISKDVYYFTNQIVNVAMVGNVAEGWVLIDAGMPHSADEIIAHAEERFGTLAPSAIILTHGHFDHVGSIVDLVKKWSVPVYAHELEFPFLTGTQAYPEPDVTVEGGLLAKISSIYPHEPINISPVLQPLPPDNSVPFLSSHWRWIHTPGHSPGHVSFYRDGGILIAGDAFVTVRADALYNVFIQKAEVNGPPRYLTTDWVAAEQSVCKLYDLHPQAVVTGHGPAMEGAELQKGLDNLVDHFFEVAVPDHGKYV
jgi:glyoxylase-like metal-dependent hydrolase (beta-lactamase superfamily II)